MVEDAAQAERQPMLPEQRRHKRLQGVPVLGGPRGLIDLLDLRRLGVHLPPHHTRVRMYALRLMCST